MSCIKRAGQMANLVHVGLLSCSRLVSRRLTKFEHTGVHALLVTAGEEFGYEFLQLREKAPVYWLTRTEDKIRGARF